MKEIFKRLNLVLLMFNIFMFCTLCLLFISFSLSAPNPDMRTISFKPPNSTQTFSYDEGTPLFKDALLAWAPEANKRFYIIEDGYKIDEANTNFINNVRHDYHQGRTTIPTKSEIYDYLRKKHTFLGLQARDIGALFGVWALFLFLPSLLCLIVQYISVGNIYKN
jgi:hypothetical protein